MSVSRLVNPACLDLEFIPARQPAEENVSLERLYGAKGAEYARRFGRRGVEAFYRGLSLAEAEKQIAGESEQPAAPIAASKPAEEPAAQSDLAAQRKAAAQSFVEAFDERGLIWFTEGKTFLDCMQIVADEELARREAAMTPLQRLNRDMQGGFGQMGVKQTEPAAPQTGGIEGFERSLKLPEHKAAGVGALPVNQ
jgi:hypothetical protein